MSDLISRSDLINKIRGIVPGSQDVDFIVRLIENQPTAYSVDKVVEELEERKALYERLVGYESKNGTSTERNQHIKAIDVVSDAIEIVKQGGVSEE